MDFSISPLTKEITPTSPASSGKREAASEVAAAPPNVERAVDEKALKERVEEVNHAFRAMDDHLQFSVHKGTNRVVIRLVDTDTEEVLREFPSEKFLDLVARLQKLSGTNVDVTL